MTAPREDASALTLPFERAVAHIIGEAERAPGEHFVVGITGPVGAGKSTLARAVSTCVLATDDYLPDHEEVAREEADAPTTADLQRAHAALTALRSGRATEVPEWSFIHHRVVGARVVAPAPVIACEGIHAHEPPLDELLDLRVYVDAPESQRLERWERLAESGERGWDVETTRAYFRRVAEPTFHQRGQRLREAAHLIVINP